MHVCVIGGGASGLAAAKQLREEDIEVDILEKRDGFGGLWYFDEKMSTVTDNTTASTSKTFLQFSDFPMEKEIDYFPHHTVYLQYLNNYVEKNNLLPLIKYNHEVKKLQRIEGDKWEVTAQCGNDTTTKVYDGVIVCSGLHHVPMIPDVESADQFGGEIIHSSYLPKDPNYLKDKNVVVVGSGESGADLVHDLAGKSKNVYMSLRKGAIITMSTAAQSLPADHGSYRAKVWLPRIYLHDLHHCCIMTVRDQYSPFRMFYTIASVIPLILLLPFYPKTVGKELLFILKGLFNPKNWIALFQKPQRHGEASGVELAKACEELCAESPKSEAEKEERFWKLRETFAWYSGGLHNNQPFTKSPWFFNDVIDKTVKIVPNIKQYMGGKTIKFDDGIEREVDIVVLCTGFKSHLPYLQEQDLDGRDLYKNVFMPKQPNIAFMGFARPNIGAAPPIVEMQSRWISGIFKGRIKLPSQAEMQHIVENDAEVYTMSRKQHAKRLTSLIDYHAYMEDIAGKVGCRPQFSKVMFSPKLLYTYLFAPLASFQYRLHGYGAKPEAAQTAMDRLPKVVPFRVVQGIILFFVMKPFFYLLGGLGIKKFRPII
ncbi:NAD(P)-binding domain-containing protein [Candidatus Albibeggiatoa sp. nov. BB20]|uniref:flavin-containing monooxygenase n=1 Tax=Candidatus Albibeggiatoa sp. nov. BB20 TaxID=3162723 RepID=UPI003365ABE5